MLRKAGAVTRSIVAPTRRNHGSAVKNKSVRASNHSLAAASLGRKCLTHKHSSEYQVKIVHEDETEELSGWMSRQEEIAQAITGLRGSPSKAYWLQIRDILCLNCPDRELTIMEFPLTPTVAENTRARHA